MVHLDLKAPAQTALREKVRKTLVKPSSYRLVAAYASVSFVSNLLSGYRARHG